MTEVVIIDTSVLVDLLNVRGKQLKHEETVNEFCRLLEAGADFLIPLATVFETSNHIKRHGGGRRYQLAKGLRDAVFKTVDGSEFWIGTIQFPDPNEFMNWLDEYPDCAAREEDLNDLSIFKVWRRMCEMAPYRRVRIWSTDGHLANYDRIP